MGRYNESLRLSERAFTFDTAELRRVAAAAVHREPGQVHNFRKLAEGGFNRGFEMIIDSLPIIARLPYPST